MDSFQILEKLISYKTISINSNLELITFCQKLLENIGAKIKIIPNSENTKLLYQVFDQELLNIYKVVIDKKSYGEVISIVNNFLICMLNIEFAENKINKKEKLKIIPNIILEFL